MINEQLNKLKNEWLVEVTIDEIQEKLDRNEITSRELVLMYLSRIAEIDQSGPMLNSIIEVNPEALHIAAALDYERKTKGSRGPLHGIPILIKDNIDTADKMHTSAGSLVLANSYAKEDATLVRQLREAGAVILGKTNLTEWANFIAEDMPTGYSSRGGQVLNPYGVSFIVGGSSAGSGAAIAANLSVVAVGTETSGSILSPASQNSLVGIKPTVGLISRKGIIPISHTQDTAGPMARTVKDATILLNSLRGTDSFDSATHSNELANYDFTQNLKVDGLSGKRIGIARNTYFDELKDSQVSVMDEAIKKLEDLGATVIDLVDIPTTNEQWDINVLLYEFKNDLNAYLNTIDPIVGVHSLTDVIKANEKLGEKALKYGQQVFLDADATSGNLTDPQYIESLEKDDYLSKTKGIDAAMKEHELDAIVFPNNIGAMIPAKAGYPSITVPAGYTLEGEPVGITFTAKAYMEPILIEIAYSYEQGTKHRVSPF
ncbi:amidase [Bacillus sp. UMB0899]|uniref:amidase family protein n=1 Tax=Metabacillus schmidteae TaxID=2730405 RepID=UPI000C7FB122|nr:amidase family protein [Metabacillus schmidteae]PMC40322.1 amidase [Bacillus sp. UMB0899]